MSKLFEYLDSRGIRQRWLATATGKHESSLSRIKAGTEAFDMAFAEACAAALEKPLSELFSDEELRCGYLVALREPESEKVA